MRLVGNSATAQGRRCCRRTYRRRKDSCFAEQFAIVLPIPPVYTGLVPECVRAWPERKAGAMGGNRYGGGSKSLMFPVQNIYVSFCVGIHPARQGGTVGFHGYSFGMDSISLLMMLSQFSPPKIRPARSVSFMSFPSLPRTRLRASVSSFREGRCCSFGDFAFGR